MRFPRRPPPTLTVLARPSEPARQDLVASSWNSPTSDDGRYLHWDELWYRVSPEHREVVWAKTKASRRSRSFPLLDMTMAYAGGNADHAQQFSFTDLPAIQRRLHELDRTNLNRTLMAALGNEDALTDYRIRQLVEEAISSSELEGARPSTREVARQLVREARTPSSRDERMIWNNWRAMQRILEIHRSGAALSVEHLLELHRILGEDALEVADAEGIFRGSDDVVEISDAEGNVWYTPPPAMGIEARVAALLRFANGEDDDAQTFLHPILRAILCHFWLAFEHPFRDGNGRMARALFYWCMLRQGYEMAEFLSISGPIDRSAQKYYLAFVHTETDEGDLTYFFLHQLDVISSALADLTRHLDARIASMKRLESTLDSFVELNHRQRALLDHALRHSASSYTITGHARSHDVHYITAQKDIADLVERGLLASRQDGQKKRFFAAPNSSKQRARSKRRR